MTGSRSAKTDSPTDTFDPGLEVLVRLSAEIARGVDGRLEPILDEAIGVADPVEVEEALLQSYLFLGYPLALNAIAAWRSCSGRPAPAGPFEDDPRAWDRRGQEVCREVYGSAYPSLRENISTLRPEMDLWMIREGYGKVLGRPGLALWRRECCIVALLAVLGVGPQLRSHLRGALRTGAHPTLVDGVLQAVRPRIPDDRRETVRRVWQEVLARWEER